MISLTVLLWMNVILFGIIGALRGWAKELLVTFSLVAGLFILFLIEAYVPVVKDWFTLKGTTSFWLRSGIVMAMVFFGYQTPNSALLLNYRKKMERGRTGDALLGAMIGLINGFMILGTLWYFMHKAQYPFAPVITAPPGETAAQLIKMFPPSWLVPPYLWIAVGVILVVVLLIFL